MKVTDLKYQKRNPNRVSIFVDDEYSFSLSVNNVLKYKLYPGFELNEALITRILSEDLYARLGDRCTKYLARSPKSISQIDKYLRNTLYKKKGDWYTDVNTVDIDDLVNTTIDRMIELGLLDDRSYAELYANSRLIKKPLSKFELTGELMSKGVSREIIDEVVAAMVPDDESAALKALEKKYRTTTLLKSDKKAIAFLQRKGYSWDVISKLITDDV